MRNLFYGLQSRDAGLLNFTTHALAPQPDFETKFYVPSAIMRLQHNYFELMFVVCERG